MSEGNDSLVPTANTQKTIWSRLQRLANRPPASGSLAKNGIEPIRVDVNLIQQSKLGRLTNIVNKTDAGDAHIAVEDKAGHQLVNLPPILHKTMTYIAQSTMCLMIMH